MREDVVTETTGDDHFGNGLGADLARLRSRVRADRRATSTPPLAFGSLVVTYAIVGQFAGVLGASGRHLVALLFWPVLTAATLLAMWWWSRRHALREGVGEGRPSYRTVTAGYLGVLLVTVVLVIPVLFIGVFLPLVWPAAVLLAIGVWQRDRTLRALGAGLAVAGVAEGALVALFRGPPPAWSWVPSAFCALAGVALISAGLVIRRRERTLP
jgi:hypothetical protein